jgi:hypothetical protein
MVLLISKCSFSSPTWFLLSPASCTIQDAYRKIITAQILKLRQDNRQNRQYYS